MTGRYRMFVGLLLLASIAIVPTANAQSLLDPVTHPKFVNPLPVPSVIDATRGGFLVMDMKETTQSLGLVDPMGNPLMTRVWGYGKRRSTVTYPGPTILAKKDRTVFVKWRNKLPPYNFPNGPGAHLLPVDIIGAKTRIAVGQDLQPVIWLEYQGVVIRVGDDGLGGGLGFGQLRPAPQYTGQTGASLCRRHVG